MIEPIAEPTARAPNAPEAQASPAPASPSDPPCAPPTARERSGCLLALTAVLGQRRIAERLLAESQSLRRALGTPGDLLRRAYGVSASRAAAWDAMRALQHEGAREAAASSGPLAEPIAAAAALVPLFALRRREAFFVLALDPQLRPLRAPILVQEGLADSVCVEPRRIFELLLREEASAALLGHNHPSGVPTPSWQDRALTQRLQRIGAELGVPVLDHFVIAGAQAYSIGHDRLIEVRADCPPTPPRGVTAAAPS